MSMGGTFKTRWYGHNSDMEVYKENETEMSKYILKLKRNNTIYNIKWKILHHIGHISNPQGICMTCTYKKMEELNAEWGNLFK